MDIQLYPGDRKPEDSVSSELSLEQPGLSSHLGLKPQGSPTERLCSCRCWFDGGDRLLSGSHLLLQSGRRPLLRVTALWGRGRPHRRG